jgi:hypothetical protein
MAELERPTPHVDDEVELLEDHTRPIGPRRVAGRRIGGRLGRSTGGAVAAALVVTAIALGAATRGSTIPAGPSADGPGARPAAAAAVGSGGDATGVFAHAGGDTWKLEQRDGEATEPEGKETADASTTPDAPDASPSSEPSDATEPSASPSKEPEPTPYPVKGLELALKLSGGKVIVDWSGCDPAGFVAYKVIRSTNDAATWPLGRGDSLIFATESPAKTAVTDGAAPAGKTAWYRVVALVSWEGKTIVGCSSAVRSIAVPAPAPTSLDLQVAIVEGHPKLVWTSCAGLDFDYYKVVRSKDEPVSWPLGDGDTLVAAVGVDGATKLYDGEAPAGKTLWYRVFCVRSTEAGYVTVASSPVRSVTTPAPEPIPDPVAMSLSVEITAEGAVLHWSAAAGNGFTYYKVVRSMTTDNPSYLPWTDGTELIAVIENGAVTGYTDGAVESGQTWTYRIQSIGYIGGQKVLLGQTEAVSVTVP